jgi:hypothetical protein
MSDLWTTWIGQRSPAEVLRQTDQAIAAGTYESRREAFIDYARQAIRNRQPDVPDDCTPEKLGKWLQDYAEGSEFVGP